MNQNYQDKINKIITVLDTLLSKQPTTTTQQQQEQQTLADLVNKLKQEEIKEIESLGSLGDTYLSEKSNWLSEKTNLEKDKKEAETALITEKKKLSEELVTKLDGLGLPEEKLTELKTLLADLKDSKTKVELSETDRKELAKELQPTNYWAIGACVFAGLTCLIVAGFGIFIKSKKE